jgi:hypothetical protein
MNKTLVTSLAIAGSLVAALNSVSSANAASISATLPEYDGTGPFSSYPQPPVTVGTFSYSIPSGEEIVAASISGTFGNSTVPNSSAVQVLLQGQQVAECIFQASCWTGQTPETWSYIFNSSQFSLLSSGSAILTAIQTNDSIIRLGVTRLNIETRPVPVPAVIPGIIIAGLYFGKKAIGRKQTLTTMI